GLRRRLGRQFADRLLALGKLVVEKPSQRVVERVSARGGAEQHGGEQRQHAEREAKCAAMAPDEGDVSCLFKARLTAKTAHLRPLSRGRASGRTPYQRRATGSGEIRLAESSNRKSYQPRVRQHQAKSSCEVTFAGPHPALRTTPALPATPPPGRCPGTGSSPARREKRRALSPPRASPGDYGRRARVSISVASAAALSGLDVEVAASHRL